MFGDVTQVQWKLSRCDSHHRILEVDGNLILQQTFNFRVSEDQHPGAIDFWEQVDLKAGDLGWGIVQPGEEISMTELARRLDHNAKTPSGQASSGPRP